MENFLPYLGFAVMTGLYLLERLWYRKDTTKLMDRIMARGYEEYQYYDKKYQTDLNELSKIRKDERKVRYEEKDVFEDDSNPPEQKEKIKKILKQYGSDWGADEVDTAALIDMEEERIGRMVDDKQENDLA